MAKSTIGILNYIYIDSKDYSIICDVWYYTFNRTDKHYTVGSEQIHEQCIHTEPKQIIKSRTRTKVETMIIL